MGTRIRNSDKFGLRPSGARLWVFRVPEYPQRKVIIRYVGRGHHPTLDTYHVWLSVKRKPKLHVVHGQLFDAVCKAAEIIVPKHKHDYEARQ